MNPTVALIAPGNMGAPVGGRMVENGLKVLTSLTGRSSDSVARAREAGLNVELMWLLRRLTPCFRTIATFRKDNWAALKAVNREFVLMMRELNLVGGEVVAIDGAFFHGDASRKPWCDLAVEKFVERIAIMEA